MAVFLLLSLSARGGRLDVSVSKFAMTVIKNHLPNLTDQELNEGVAFVLEEIDGRL